MKNKFLAVALASFAFSTVGRAATILASWNDWADTTGSVLDADFVSPGFVASVGYDGSRVSASFSSTDGTFGTLAGGPTTADGGLLVRNSTSPTLTLSITNNTLFAYSIDTFHFDFLVRNSNDGTSFNAFNIVYTSGGLGPNATSVGSRMGLPSGGAAESDYSDYDFTLADNLTDTTLAVGESALFTITFSGQTGSNPGLVSSVFDNVAFTGTMIPEPSTALLCLIGLATAFLRRRR